MKGLSTYHLPNDTVMVCREPGLSSTIFNTKGWFLKDNPFSHPSPLLFMQLSIISLLSNGVHFCLSYLGQSSIVSQTLAGIILGPSCLGRIEAFASTFFPDDSKNTLETIATVGMMFFFFEMSVKTDIKLIRQCGAKAITIGILVFIVPLIFGNLLSFIIQQLCNLDESLSRSLSLIASGQSTTAFLVIVCLLTELRMINTELGRLAVSTGIVGDLIGITTLTVSLPVLQMKRKIQMIPVMLGWITTSALVAFIVLIFRPAMLWIIKNTPEGKNVKEEYIFGVFLVIMIIGYMSEVVGTHYIFGPMVLGLAVPDGPPLGSALVNKLDALIAGILLPTYLAICGLKMDIFEIGFTRLWVLGFVIILIFIVKTLSAMLPCLYYDMPVRDSLALSLIMNSKGIVEIVTLNIFMEGKIVDKASFTVGTITMLLLQAVLAPSVKTLYDPSKRYISSVRCSIQHSKQDADLRILLCVHKQETVPTDIELIEVSNGTETSPISVYVLQLVELIGRNTPILVYHEPQLGRSSSETNTDRIINAFRQYESQHERTIKVYPYTAIAHLSTMHDDVCNLAIDKRVNIVILPFHKEIAIDGEVGSENHSIKSMNRQILERARCSVGILVDRCILRGNLTTPPSHSAYRIGVIFLGGADDGEALAYGARMAQHNHTVVTVIRFLAYTCDNPRERKLANDTMEEFKCSNEDNDNIEYREEVVKDGEGFATVLTSMGYDYDLLMVGKRQRNDSRLLSGLNEWSECPELGIVGDMLASPDLKGTCSILVLQQAKLRTEVKSRNGRDLIHDVPYEEEADEAWTNSMERYV